MTGSGSRPGAEKSRFKAAQSVLNPSGGQQTYRRHGGEALCAMHLVGARPTGNTMNTMNTGEEHLAIEKAMFLENAGVHGPHENCAEK